MTDKLPKITIEPVGNLIYKIMLDGIDISKYIHDLHLHLAANEPPRVYLEIIADVEIPVELAAIVQGDIEESANE